MAIFCDQTEWSVSAFNPAAFGDPAPNAVVDTPDPTHWNFQHAGTADAGNSWTARWTRTANDTIHMVFSNAGGEFDSCDVLFVSPNWFVAVKDQNLFRIGRRV